MNNDFSIRADQIPKLLAGARIYVAPHQGGTKAMPNQIKAWLKAMGAVLVTSVATPKGKAATHVLHQNERQGYDPFHNARRCRDALTEAHGPALRLVEAPRLASSAAPVPGRVEVVLCDSDAFLGACQDAVQASLRDAAAARRRDALFDRLPAVSPAFVGF